MVSRDNRVRNREVCEGEETRRNPYLVDYEEQRNSGMYRVRRTAGTRANSQKRHTVHEQTGRQIIAMKTREEVPRFRQNVDGGAKEKGFAVYAAMLDETAQKLGTFDFPQKTAVIIGNEGHGVAAKIAAECKKLYIPIKNAESLNAAAAAAVIFWEVGKGQSNDR